MKLTIERTIESEIEIDTIRCVFPVRHGEEDIPNDYPHRKGEIWDITIDVETGQIRDWPTGVEPRSVYTKVVDCGSYYLWGPETLVASREGNYVPSCIPDDYGDYFEFNIDANGKISNWNFDDSELAEQFDFVA